MRWATAATAAAMLCAGAPSHAQGSAAGLWKGQIEIPSQPLAVHVNLAEDDGGWTGSIDIPAQGATALPLGGIAIGDDASVTFAIRGVPGDPVFSGRLEGGVIRGQFRQGGAEFPFTLGRETSANVGRPQTPKPPFPYAKEEVRFDAGPVRLAGTLTVQPASRPSPRCC